MKVINGFRPPPLAEVKKPGFLLFANGGIFGGIALLFLLLDLGDRTSPHKGDVQCLQTLGHDLRTCLGTCPEVCLDANPHAFLAADSENPDFHGCVQSADDRLGGAAVPFGQCGSDGSRRNLTSRVCCDQLADGCRNFVDRDDAFGSFTGNIGSPVF